MDVYLALQSTFSVYKMGGRPLANATYESHGPVPDQGGWSVLAIATPINFLYLQQYGPVTISNGPLHTLWCWSVRTSADFSEFCTLQCSSIL